LGFWQDQEQEEFVEADETLATRTDRLERMRERNRQRRQQGVNDPVIGRQAHDDLVQRNEGLGMGGEAGLTPEQQAMRAHLRRTAVRAEPHRVFEPPGLEMAVQEDYPRRLEVAHPQDRYTPREWDDWEQEHARMTVYTTHRYYVGQSGVCYATHTAQHRRLLTDGLGFRYLIVVLHLWVREGGELALTEAVWGVYHLGQARPCLIWTEADLGRQDPHPVFDDVPRLQFRSLQ